LTGVEISASYAGHTVHIVGLGFDATHESLREGLHALRHSRGPRAREMARQLELAGIAGAYEGALRYVGNPDLISRTHFARHLVDIGVCSDMADVFRRYLTEGKPGFVPQRWASVAEAVQWITAARGVAVLAHPARYNLSGTLEHALLSEFKASGGQGIEVTCGGHTAA
ncbi:MAG: PHP domain-containing protein, partial [Comamonas sp.]